MTDRTSPLTQRVRRRIGTGGLSADAGPPSVSPGGQAHPDTGALFETQIVRLSSALRELYAIDRQREAELRQMREQARLAAEHARALAATLAQLDALIAEVNRLLQPAPDPPPSSTLFERMLAHAAASSEHTRREALIAWASGLIDLRTRLAALLDG
ncbi:MAG: hypothetical protein HGA45_10695 [Chloroflexales bacterium]|nr:hypothetical protein [Chloroflexales bacterium]